MITIFIITDNVRHWAEDKGYPNECIKHTREKTTVCIGDIQILILNGMVMTTAVGIVVLATKILGMTDLIISFVLIVERNGNEQICSFRTNSPCAEYS